MNENVVIESFDQTDFVSSGIVDPLANEDVFSGESESMDGYFIDGSVSSPDAFLGYRLVPASLVESGVDPSVQLLQGIDYKLSIIMFFLLVSWTFARIRNAVRSFTGRSVDDPERR